MSTVNGIVICGFGGHARSVADVACSLGIANLIFVDENAADGETFYGFPVYKNFPEQLPEGWAAFPASGNNATRLSQIAMLEEWHWPVYTIISATATIGINTTVGAGTFIGHHSHVGPNTTIGKGCIMNTGSITEHDCNVGDFTHISIGARIAGKTRIGSHCFIGAGSVVIDGIKVTNKVTLGANGCIVKDIDESGVYVGTPARIIKN